MTEELTIEQRFALQRARFEVSRMSRPALEKTAEFTGEDGSTFTAGFQIGSDLFWS